MSRFTRLVRISLLAVAAATMAVVGTLPVEAAAPTAVGANPATWTPWLLRTTPDQYVYEIDQCGSRMYAVGRLSAIGQGAGRYTRGNAFSFSSTNGAVSAWNPEVNGPVRSIAFSPDCSTAYLGGKFTTVKGVSARNIVAVDTTTGAVKTGFARSASGELGVVEYVRGQIIVGGRFTAINGVQRTRMASLNPTTGAVTPYLNLQISGNYPNTSTNIFNSQVSHGGDRMLVEGVFTSFGGRARQQIAMLDLGPTSVTVNNWYSNEFSDACAIGFYTRDAAWSPNDQTVYVATTGAWLANGGHTGPRRGLCDAAASFPSTAATVSHRWINYTGCDSLYAVDADSSTVYIGGHERWANNPNGCDAPGPGAVSRPGIAALAAGNGQATSWNPTRALGYGADDMLVTSAGLWVASDIFSNGAAQQCGGVPNRGGICFFPN